jgi:hypothetical protein
MSDGRLLTGNRRYWKTENGVLALELEWSVFARTRTFGHWVNIWIPATEDDIINMGETIAQ